MGTWGWVVERWRHAVAGAVVVALLAGCGGGGPVAAMDMIWREGLMSVGTPVLVL